MVLLEYEVFLQKLTQLAQGARDKSSFTITLKRYDGNDKPTPKEGTLPKPEEYMCLIRAKSKSKKLSTVVKQHDVPKFMELFGKVMKSNMDGLKKVKKTKNKAKAAQG
ncbi:signal recognition particle 14 kDa protein [Culicoides brevitarsis]|uniref:signal recognition particle 14 kDa protein n=1 Tax=Culicoides brevitarsis TaxID=469753 RepID=UPI00307BED62